MQAFMIFTFSVLVYFVVNTFHAKTNAATYSDGVNALLERNDVHGGFRAGTLRRGPAVEPRSKR